ncbi:MAG: glycosyltransferase family 2 protein [Candidatus Staskawiczbacteria bacterium]|jgi:glycosyltransferase involved in cell wall biosynthesis
MENNLPLVTIVISCRNEEGFIANCLGSFLEQDYPKDKMEILVVDGMSQDNTRKIINDYLAKYSFIKLIDNLNKFTPFAFNLGIKSSKGEIIFLAGAHAKYDKNFILKSVQSLYEYKADVAGGALKTVPKKNTIWAKAIAFSLASSFGAGNSAFRVGVDKPTWVDTVFGGGYKKEVFDKVGLFNENLIRSQDMEFAQRMKKAGIKILIVPDIVAYYYPKHTLIGFLKHNFKDGIWAVYPLKFVKIPFKLRHYIPLIFVLTLPISIWPYIIVSLYFSWKIASREKDAKLFFVLPVVFFVRHFSYGLGSFFGLIKLIIGK